MFAYLLSMAHIIVACLLMNIIMYRHMQLSVQSQIGDLRSNTETSLRETADVIKSEAFSEIKSVATKAESIEKKAMDKVDALSKTSTSIQDALHKCTSLTAKKKDASGKEVEISKQVRTIMLPDYTVQRDNFKLFVEHSVDGIIECDDIICINIAVLDKDCTGFSKIDSSACVRVHENKVIIKDASMVLSVGSVVRCSMQVLC